MVQEVETTYGVQVGPGGEWLPGSDLPYSHLFETPRDSFRYRLQFIKPWAEQAVREDRHRFREDPHLVTKVETLCGLQFAFLTFKVVLVWFLLKNLAYPIT